MFSFALFDSYKKLIFLVRDRFGEKPLYWGRVKLRNNSHINPFVFASEVVAFKSIPGFCNNINSESFIAFTKYGYIPAPLSIYENIYQLNPGTMLIIPLENAEKEIFQMNIQ